MHDHCFNNEDITTRSSPFSIREWHLQGLHPMMIRPMHTLGKNTIPSNEWSNDQRAMLVNVAKTLTVDQVRVNWGAQAVLRQRALTRLVGFRGELLRFTAVAIATAADVELHVMGCELLTSRWRRKPAINIDKIKRYKKVMCQNMFSIS